MKIVELKKDDYKKIVDLASDKFRKDSINRFNSETYFLCQCYVAAMLNYFNANELLMVDGAIYNKKEYLKNLNNE